MSQPLALQTRGLARSIPSLDGWRAIAVGMVVFGHAKLIPGRFASLGVAVFFFLSGYLITTLMKEEFAKSGTVSLKNFFLRRLLRLTPPLVTTLAVAYAMAWLGWIDGKTSPFGFASLLFYFHNYYYVFWEPGGSVPLGVGVYWSLAVEQHFYLLFPLLFLVFNLLGSDSPKACPEPGDGYGTRNPAGHLVCQGWFIRGKNNRKLVWFLVSVCLAVLLWRIVLAIGLHVEYQRVYFTTDTRLDAILFGCLLALWRNPMEEPPDRGSMVWRNPWLIGGSAVIVLDFLLVRNLTYCKTFHFTLESLSLAPFFFFSIRDSKQPIFKVLGQLWLVRIGELSYSIYLIHCVVLFNIDRYFQARWVQLAISFAVIGVYVLVVERFVERPFAKFRKALRGTKQKATNSDVIA